MLTLFTTPKPFLGEIKRIQRNAIKSWTLLKPRPEIILLGDEEGAEGVAKEFKIRFLPKIERNEKGTPFINSIFKVAQEEATQPLLCYINADTILMSDFMIAIKKLLTQIPNQNFLLVGRKWDIDKFDSKIFEDLEWEEKLKNYLIKHCRQYDAFEYFVFPQALNWNMPPFLPRLFFDNWLIYKARAMEIPVIDGTTIINAVHQRHGHQHFLKEELLPLESSEVRYNLKLLGFWHKYTLVHRTHVLTPDGLKEAKNDIKAFIEQLRMVEIYLNYLLKRKFYPYSYPLYIVLKGIKSFFKNFISYRR